MSDNPEDHELVHYGTKGMKWGVRKKSKESSKSSSPKDRSERDRKIRKVMTKTAKTAAVGAIVTAHAAIAFDAALHTSSGKAAIARGVQFVGTHTKTKYAQAAVLKSARFLDSVYGLG